MREEKRGREARTISISAGEAQSKPVPRAARSESMAGSGLHLTA